MNDQSHWLSLNIVLNWSAFLETDNKIWLFKTDKFWVFYGPFFYKSETPIVEYFIDPI